MTLLTNQQQFLANTHNESRFILGNILVKQANNDTDDHIV